MGPMYGNIRRHFNEKLQNCVDQEINIEDQIKYVINEIKTNPNSRRIILTSFNPSRVNEGVLWPCHSITVQFYVQNDYLDMFCYNRSSDVFLGLPFNIAISKLTNKIPRYFNLSLGDIHIYEQHVDAVKEQIERFPYMVFTDFNTIEEVEKLTFNDFKIDNYKYYSGDRIRSRIN